jgi:endonuclease/exonuclease/phosphatase family metal-dependent hydrolase
MDGGAQKIYAFVKKGGEFTNPVLPTDYLTLDLQDPFEVDITGDYQLEGYEFTRLPLVIEGTIAGDNSQLRIVILHTKSKYVHRGRSLWNNLDTRMQFIAAAMKNRRRISAEAMRVRLYIDELLNLNLNSHLIVTGDFNDGPGIDYFERRYLTHNVTDILLGSTYYPNRIFNHAFLGRVPEEERFTAIFDDFVDDISDRPILLDHILVSPALSPSIQNSGIAHQEYQAGTDDNASGRQRHVSDHRPVFLDL